MPPAAPGPARVGSLLRHWAGPAFAAIDLFILAVTLAPFRPEPRPDLRASGPAGHMDALTERAYRYDIVNNLVLFLPFGGAGAALLRVAAPRLGPLPRAGLVALCAGALALGIELAQLYLPGRTAALADVAANMAGALLGTITAEVWRCPSSTRNGSPS